MGEGPEDPRPHSEEDVGVGPVGTTSTDFFRPVLTLVRTAEALPASSRAFLTAVLWGGSEPRSSVRRRAADKPPIDHLPTTDSTAVTSPRS